MRERISGAGFQVDYDPVIDYTLYRKCRENPPNAIVIDLSRLPSHGREVAIALRQSAKTRQIPIVFCDGQAEKVKLTKQVLPDATYCTSRTLLTILRRVRPLEDPLRPADMMNRYGSRTTAAKLGIKAGSRVAIIDAPADLNQILGELPKDTEFVEGDGDVTLCFAHTVDNLRSEISRVRRLASKSKLWILWRKKSAAGHTGVTETLVRETGIDLGLVDYKICSVDRTWSALAFAQRKQVRSAKD